MVFVLPVWLYCLYLLHGSNCYTVKYSEIYLLFNQHCVNSSGKVVKVVVIQWTRSTHLISHLKFVIKEFSDEIAGKL